MRPISPQQLREALCQMLSDPETRRLIVQSALGSVAVRGGSPSTPAGDVTAGTFGGSGGGGQYIFLANGATTTPLTVKGAASQSAPLQNWKNSAGDVLATVQGDGNVGIGTPAPGARLEVNGEVSAPVIKETATEYSGSTDITDHSGRKVFFDIPGSETSVFTYYKIARVKILGTYSNVHFYGWLDTGGSHIGLERRMEVEVRAFTMGDATQSTLVYSKRGQNTEYFCAYKIEDGDGSGHDYYDLYVTQRWVDNTSGEIDIRVGCGSGAVRVWQTGSSCGTGTPGGTLQSPNANYAIDTAGNVGIGTATPGARLEVNGEVSAPVIKETAAEYSGSTDITDHSPRKVFFNVPEANNTVLTYYKIARIKILAPYSNVHFYGWLDSGGSHVGLEKRMELGLRAYTMADATDSTLVYSKRGQNTEYFCAYKIENGDGSGHDYYDLYVKQRWVDNTNGEIDIRVGCGTAAVTVWQTGSNCGTGTPGGTLQSPNANYTVDTLNQIVFLRPLEPAGDDGAAINEAIANKLPASGGIIMLTPGTYNIHTTIEIKNNGVKLRGYGGNRDADPASSTLLQWVAGSVTDEAVVRLGGLAQYVHGIDISDLAVDGAAGPYVDPSHYQAEVGIELASVMDCVLRNVHVRNMRRSTIESITGGVGIRLISTAQNNCDWNSFYNCSVWGAAKGVVLTNPWGHPPPPPEEQDNTNPSHNIFLGLDIRYWGDYPNSHGDVGLHLQVCDGNVFYRVWMKRFWGSGGQGWGVLIEYPNYTASNYFHQLIPSAGQSAGPGGSFLIQAPAGPPPDHKNFVFGYALGDGAQAPLATAGGVGAQAGDYLCWIDEKGVAHGFVSAAPPKLAAGNQEIGYCSAGGVAAVDSAPGSAWAVEAAVNFKTVMSQEPTGITVTVAGAYHIQAVAIKWSDGSLSPVWTGPFYGSYTFQAPGKTVSRYGFTLVVSSSDNLPRGSEYTFQAYYQTVGN